MNTDNTFGKMKFLKSKFETLNRKNKILIFGMILSTLIVLITVFAPFLEPYNPVQMDISQAFIAPCANHWFGTDNLGRDILSRVIEGARISLTVAFLVIVISITIGTAIGLISGFAGGKVDMFFMRMVDIMLAFPTIIFALAISTLIGVGQRNLIIAICCIQWTKYARIVRGETILLKNAEFIEAAKAIGNNDMEIIIKYFLPNVISKVLVMASLDIGSIILYCASLSFLGLGAQPPSPDWGAMISDAKDYIRYAPWMAIFPGLAIAVSAMAFNMLGDGTRDLLDPHMREHVSAE